MSTGVFIAGRLKSERLPGKLLLPIGGSNLWDIACDKLSKLPGTYNKYVLAEDGELVKIAAGYPELKVIVRDKNTAITDSPLSYIFKDLAGLPDKYLMFLNPCQSFISIGTIVKSLRSFERSACQYATSVKCLQNWLFDESHSSMNEINYKNLSTKEIKPIWQAAHCFHIFNKDSFFQDGHMLKPGHLLLPVPENEAIDVDTYDDYLYARWRHEICD